MKQFKSIHLLGLAFAVMAFCMSSCNSDEPALNVSDTEHVSDSNFISLDEALMNANSAFKAMLGKNRAATRSEINAELFMPRKTRANQEGLYGYYIVNYGEDEGFALLSADKRRTPVFALSENGSMHLADTSSNKGLNWYLNDYLAAGFNPGLPTIPDSVVNYDPYSLGTRTYYCEPLLKGFLSKFHQKTPYNKYCPIIDKTRALTGCIPLSVGTIVGYYNKPDTIKPDSSSKKYILNWEKMNKSSSNNGWPRLFEVLGRKSFLNATYGTDNTTSYISLVPGTFFKLGYAYAALLEFNTRDMEEELRAHRPVILNGIYPDVEGGHIWIADGGFIWELKLYANDILVQDRTEYFYHMVWGDGGRANGYFIYETLIGGKPYIPDAGTSGYMDLFSTKAMVKIWDKLPDHIN